MGRLLLAGQVFVPSELLALLLLLPALVVINRLSARPRRLVMFSGVGAVFLFERLAPFTFSGPRGEFDLWPFLGWIEVGMPVERAGIVRVPVLLLRADLAAQGSGAPDGLCHRRGRGGVLAIELLQMWQPHQAASIADPLLALGAGLVLRVVDPAARSHRLRLQVAGYSPTRAQPRSMRPSRVRSAV